MPVTATPPPQDAGVGRRWWALAIAIAIIVPLSVVGAWELTQHAPPARPATIITLAKPTFLDILCSSGGPVYYLDYFPISNVSGPVLTSQFSLGILTFENQTVAPNGTAPAPTPDLPCGAPTPRGWYAILDNGHDNPVATYPALSSGTWSNASVSPTQVIGTDEFIMITVGDPTGSDEHLVTSGVGGANVQLAGNTTFPTYQRP
jgi:hypothetical protein